MAKEPFLPLFFGDFLASTAEWEGEERALYLLLLAYQWSLGSLPSEPRRICKLVGWDWQLFERCWTTVETKFKATNAGRLLNERLEKHRARSHDISRKRAESGAKGGRAAQANARQAREQMLGTGQANSEQMLVSAEANIEANTNQMLVNGEANARNLLDPPSHPIPSQSNPEINPYSGSEFKPVTPDTPTRARAREDALGRTRAADRNGEPQRRAPRRLSSGGLKKTPNGKGEGESETQEIRRKALQLLASGLGSGEVAHVLAQYGVTAEQIAAWQREEAGA